MILITFDTDRVQSIFTRLNTARDVQDIAHILKQLILEELISQEQHKKCAGHKELDLPRIADTVGISIYSCGQNKRECGGPYNSQIIHSAIL